MCAPTASSIGKALLQYRRSAGLCGIIAVGSLHFLLLDGHGLDLSGELERHLVGLRDRGAFIGTDIGAFIRGEDAALGLVDAAGSDWLAIEQDRTDAALADAAAVVGELEAQRAFTRRQRLLGSH